MLLSNIETHKLLPRFAKTPFMTSLCSAIDEVFRHLGERVEALPCDSSLTSLAACRDDELTQIAQDLNVIPYYPDLPRSTRENIIRQSELWTRKSGTNASMIAMVNAIFDVDTTTITDNQTLYHYDIDVSGFNDASEISINRIISCLRIIGRASQTPYSFVFHHESELLLPVCAVGGDMLILYDSNDICAPSTIIPEPPTSQPIVMGAMGGENVQLRVNGQLTVYDKPAWTPVEIVFPDKPIHEPNNQMLGGTMRITGNLANRGISIDIIRV